MRKHLIFTILISITMLITVSLYKSTIFFLPTPNTKYQCVENRLNQHQMEAAQETNGTETWIPPKINMNFRMSDFVYLPPGVENEMVPISWRVDFDGEGTVPEDAWCDFMLNDSLLASHVNYTEYYGNYPIAYIQNLFWQYMKVELGWTYNITVIAYWQDETCLAWQNFTVIEYPTGEFFRPSVEIYHYEQEPEIYLYNTDFGNLTMKWEAQDSGGKMDPFPVGIQYCELYINGSLVKNFTGKTTWKYQPYPNPIQIENDPYKYSYELPVHVGERYNITVVVYDDEGYSSQDTYIFIVKRSNYHTDYISLTNNWMIIAGIITSIGIICGITRKKRS